VLKGIGIQVSKINLFFENSFLWLRQTPKLILPVQSYFQAKSKVEFGLSRAGLSRAESKRLTISKFQLDQQVKIQFRFLVPKNKSI
jgi:hypothetical protein